MAPQSLRRYVIAALAFPVVSGVGIALTRQTAQADDGCFCRPSYCEDADQTCYVLTCSDGTSKSCDGNWIAS